MSALYRLFERCRTDPAFKSAFLRNPAQTLAEAGIELLDSAASEGVALHAYENTPDHVHVVLPDAEQAASLDFSGLSQPARRVLKRLWQDPMFAVRLSMDAQAAFAEATGTRLPDTLRVSVHVQTAKRCYVILPIDAGDELMSSHRYAIGGSMLPPRPGR
jgi:hypothetical protein